MGVWYYDILIDICGQGTVSWAALGSLSGVRRTARGVFGVTHAALTLKLTR